MLNMIFQGDLWILEQDRSKWTICALWVIDPPKSRRDKVEYLFLLMINIRYDMIWQVDYKIHQ